MAVSLTVAQAAAITGPALTLARTWDFIRRDGKALYLTDHDRPLTIGSKTYHPTKTFQASATTKGGGFTERDRELTTGIDNDLITDEDLLAGLYRDCFLKEAIVNWMDLSAGQFLVDLYWIRDTTFDGNIWKGTFEGLSGWSGKQFGKNYTRICQHNLGDSRCGADKSAKTLTDCSVTDIDNQWSNSMTTDASSFSPDDVFNINGVLTWQTGDNAGLSYIVKSNNAGDITTWLEPIRPIAVGDTFTIEPGCDKTLPTCREVWDNVVNFGGFPDIIGIDKLIQTPDSKN